MELTKYTIYIGKHARGRETAVVVADACLFRFLMAFRLIDGWFWEPMSDPAVNNDANSAFIGFGKQRNESRMCFMSVPWTRLFSS